jgi:kynurenine 3-monooxygenase
VDVDLDSGAVILEDRKSGKTRREDADIVIGADGAFSRVRAAMQRSDRFDYSQDYLKHGYKELTMPSDSEDTFAMETSALHIWPRRTYMMIALPNQDATFTCTLFWPFEGENSFDSIKGEREILDFFKATFPEAVNLIPDLVEQFQQNPVGALVTVRCYPWHAGSRAVLIGDAAHAVVPFYGQGINAGFEDGTVLMECIRDHAPDWGRAFSAYTERRKHHVDALADLAIANFLEMRDHVGSPGFLLRKKTERTLHRLFPRWFVPLYTMITFTRIPYADALQKARTQDRAVMIVAFLLLAVLLALVSIWIQGAFQ